MYNTSHQVLTNAFQTDEPGEPTLIGLCEDEGYLVGLFADGRVSSWEIASSQVRWERKLWGEFSTPPLLAEGRLFVPSANGVWALDAASGEIAWRSLQDHVCMGSPLMARDLLWCGTLDGQLIGMSPETGRVDERFLLHQHGFFSSCASNGEQLFWGDPTGHVCAFDLARGKMRWRYQTHAAILACPTVDGDQLLVGTGLGQLIALSADEGLLRWSTRLQGPLQTPVSTDGELLYAVTQDGAFQVLQREDGVLLERHDAPHSFAIDGPLVTPNGVAFSLGTPWGGQICIFHRGQPPLRHYIYASPSTAPVLAQGALYVGLVDSGVSCVTGLESPPKPKPVPPPEPVVQTKPTTKAAPPKPTPAKKLDPEREKLQSRCNVVVQSAYGMFRETPDRAASVNASGVFAFDSVRWTRDLGAGGVYATPIIVDQCVYLCTFEGWLIALDLNAGEVKWKTHVTGQFWSTPAVIGNAIVVATDEGDVFTFERSTGHLISSHRFGGEINASPVIVDGVTYIADYNGKVGAYRQLDRNNFWTFQARGSVHSSIAVSHEMAVFGCKEGYVYALDRLTGELMWEFKTGGWVYSSPAIRDGIVYVGSDDHTFYVLDGFAGGRLLWKYQTNDEVVSCPAVEGDWVYVGSRDHCLYAFERTYGQMLWKYEAEDYLYGSPVVAGDVVYFASVDNYVYALERFTGALLWKYRCETHIWASPAVCDGMVIVVDKDGQVHALQDRELANTKLPPGKPKPDFNESWGGAPPHRESNS